MNVARLKRLLEEPAVAGCAIDGVGRFEAHRTVLQHKRLIRDVFTEFHEVLRALDRRYLQGTGQVIELGAGVYPVRETYPEVVATDVVDAPHLDRVMDAESMDVPDGSVRAFYLQNVFHHFPHPDQFLRELERTLEPGGGAVIIEPHDGAFAAWLYPRLFASERYDRDDPSWDTVGAGPMTGANQALSHIVFTRDRARFERDHPALEIVHREVLTNWLRYLLSGGLNFRALVPGWAAPALQMLEKAMWPLRRVLGLHHVLVLRKRGSRRVA